MIPNFWILTIKIGTYFLPSLKRENYLLLHFRAIQSDSPKVVFQLRHTLQRMAFWALWVSHSTLQLTSGIFRRFFSSSLGNLMCARQSENNSWLWNPTSMEPQEQAVAGSSASHWNTCSQEKGKLWHLRNVKDKVNVLLSYFFQTLVVLKRIL